LWDRPELTRLRRAIRERAVDVLVCFAIDCLSRDPVHLGVILSEAEHAGSTSSSSRNRSTLPGGQLIRFVRGYARRVEREKTRMRTLAGKHARVRSGKVHNHGSELYGYRRDKAAGVRVVHDAEAAIVRRVYRWVAEGVPIRTVVRRLNEGGVPAPSAGKLAFKDGRTRALGQRRRPSHPARLAPTRRRDRLAAQARGHNGGYSLRPERNGCRCRPGPRRRSSRPQEWGPVQDRLAANVAAASTRNAARPYLLRGLISCAVCGRPMRTSPEHGRRVYRCSSRETPAGACGGSRVPAEAVEGWAWSEIEAVLADPSLIAAEVERQRAPAPTPTSSRPGGGGAAAREARQAARAAWCGSSRRRTGDGFPWELVEREIARTEQERKDARARWPRSTRGWRRGTRPSSTSNRCAPTASG
jgi:site-specific DNA recombinase